MDEGSSGASLGLASVPVSVPVGGRGAATHRVARRRIVPLAVVLLLLTGCAGYQLGPTNGLAAGEKSVEIRPFANHTLEPRLTDNLTHQLRQELQRDGTFKLSTHGEPDLVVSGSITRFQRSEVTFASTDVLTVRDYRLILTAQVIVLERSTGKILLDQAVSGYTLVRVGADLTSAERQAMPLLAGDLAKNAVALLAEGRW
jgi:Lipopolysaccharide-assembly